MGGMLEVLTTVLTMGGYPGGYKPPFLLSGRLSWWYKPLLFSFWEATLVGITLLILLWEATLVGIIPSYSFSGRLPWWVGTSIPSLGGYPGGYIPLYASQEQWCICLICLPGTVVYMPHMPPRTLRTG